MAFKVSDDIGQKLAQNKCGFRLSMSSKDGQPTRMCELIDELTGQVVLTEHVPDGGADSEREVLEKAVANIANANRPLTPAQAALQAVSSQGAELESLRKENEELRARMAAAEGSKKK